MRRGWIYDCIEAPFYFGPNCGNEIAGAYSIHDVRILYINYIYIRKYKRNCIVQWYCCTCGTMASRNALHVIVHHLCPIPFIAPQSPLWIPCHQYSEITMYKETLVIATIYIVTALLRHLAL